MTTPEITYMTPTIITMAGRDWAFGYAGATKEIFWCDTDSDEKHKILALELLSTHAGLLMCDDQKNFSRIERLASGKIYYESYTYKKIMTRPKGVFVKQGDFKFDQIACLFTNTN